jgi:undecaprenyl-diphosphatase
MHKKVPHLGWLFLYATVVSYTRIYLGVHYPLDLLVGAGVGMAVAIFAWFLIVYVKREVIKGILR